MSKRFVLALCVMAGVFTSAGAPAEESAIRTFTATLQSPINSPQPVETSASGTLIVTLNKDNSQRLDYQLILQDIENVYMAHLHLSEEDGRYGPMVAWLFPPHHATKAKPVEGPFSGVLCSDIIEAADLEGALAGKTIQDLINRIVDGKVSVNVHTKRHPSGELEGWLKE